MKRASYTLGSVLDAERILTAREKSFFNTLFDQRVFHTDETNSKRPTKKKFLKWKPFKHIHSLKD